MSETKDGIILEVNAGPHARRNAFVSTVLVCDENCPGEHKLYEVDANGACGALVPSQCSGAACVCDDEECSCDCYCEITWMIPQMDAGETKRFMVVNECGCEEQADGGVAIEVKPGEQADISVNGELFTSYVVKEGISRPFCYPVKGPGGKIIVREVNIPQKEDIDHPHHKGIWVAQGHVNDGEDNWSDLNDHATSVNQFIEVIDQGPVFGELYIINDWVSGRRGVNKKMLEEHTRIRVFNTPDNARVMEWNIAFVATEGGFFFGDTKEAGTISVRVKESMEERNTGTIRNSYGAVSDAENWGKRAEWVDYYGEVEGDVMGISIMDHPLNHGFPTHWHVRGYGLFTANQWGLHDFYADNGIRGDFAVKAGDVLEFTFRIYIHDGDTDHADVAGQYMNFIHPPKVSVVE